jgi:type II secretory pathway predicted ATPase ExeA
MKRLPSVAPLAGPIAAPFPYRDWTQAKNVLETAITRGAFYALVTGASGTGKTSLCHALSIDRQKSPVLYLSASRISLLSITRYFAQVLRVTPRRSSVETTKAMVDVLRERSARPLIWIDEADRLPSGTLTELRSLIEFDPEPTPLFSLVLSGPPELRSTLDAPDMFPLKRRIWVRVVLEGLHRDELDPFLAHRFGEGAKRVPLALKDDLFERTRGAPALIDRVVGLALGRTAKTLADADLREALDAQGL